MFCTMDTYKDNNSNFLFCRPNCGPHCVDSPFISCQRENCENALCNSNNLVQKRCHELPSARQLQCLTWSAVIHTQTKEKSTGGQYSLNRTRDVINPHSSFRLYVDRSSKSSFGCKAVQFGNHGGKHDASHACVREDPTCLLWDECVYADLPEDGYRDKLKLLSDRRYPDPYPSDKEAYLYSTRDVAPPVISHCSCCGIVSLNRGHGSRMEPCKLRPNPPRIATPNVADTSTNGSCVNWLTRRTFCLKRQLKNLQNFPQNRIIDVSPVTHYQDFSSLSYNSLGTDQHPHKSQGASSVQPYLSQAEIISHNQERNRVTTAQTRSSKHSKCSQKFPPRFGINSPRGSLTLGSRIHLAANVSGSLQLSASLSPWPFQVHYSGAYLEGEYLPAELVYSLHLRNYTIGEVLGTGVSSTVRRVTEKSTGTEYAVKIIDISGEKSDLIQVEQMKRDTFREISILRMCAGHPHIIELHDVFETPTFIFLVFEICKKGELFDFLTSVVSLSEKRTRVFMRQLVEAVAFFHDKNIVHRDLKPENILLDDALNIKVSDFGFATVVEDGEELSELCGTPGYLAPEVLAHSMYDNVPGYGKEVDMWACGVIMYTLLCGAPPFWNRRQMMMLRSIMAAEYTFNSPEWNDITETPKDLIRKLLVVNPANRLTAKQVLLHPFFQVQLADKKFKAIRKFKAAVWSIMFHLRIMYFPRHPQQISVNMMRDNPYNIKMMRKVIDTCAFGMYKHWVKRVDNQNRAALFEHTLRDDWKHAPIVLDLVRA